MYDIHIFTQEEKRGNANKYQIQMFHTNVCIYKLQFFCSKMFWKKIICSGIRFSSIQRVVHLNDLPHMVKGNNIIRNITARNIWTSRILLESKDNDNKQELARIVTKLKLTFTCKKCGTQNADKLISKVAYKKGIVIIRCDGCKNNHLIADNLGWFDHPMRKFNIEKAMAVLGSNVHKFQNDRDGHYEMVNTVHLDNNNDENDSDDEVDKTLPDSKQIGLKD